MKAKNFIFVLLNCILVIAFLHWKEASNYNHSIKQKVKYKKLKDTPMNKSSVPKDHQKIHLKSNSDKKEKVEEQDLKHWMSQMEKRYIIDRERVKKVCNKYIIPKRKIINKEFLDVDRNHKIALCSHAKVGSTTWKNHFKDLLPSNIRDYIMKKSGHNHIMGSGQWSLKKYFTITKNDFPSGNSDWISPYSINTYIKNNRILSISFVRHPFERLVSAYNDKINNNFMKINGYEKWFKNDDSFSSFINLVLFEYRSSCFPGISSRFARLPTNWYNKNCEYKINRHWRPFGFRCSYCDINYDLIGRMETWNDDLNYIIRKRGLQKVLPLQKADNLHFHASKQNTEQMTKEYFSKLSRKQKEDLYHMFRMDFEMFNYDPKMYL